MKKKKRIIYKQKYFLVLSFWTRDKNIYIRGKSYGIAIKIF